MTKFHYTAIKNGEKYIGDVEAKDRFEVYKIIRSEGGRVLSVHSDKWRKFSVSYWNARLSTIKEHDKIVFANNLAAMLGAGLSITRALSVSEKQTKNPRLKLVITTVKSDIQKGGTFHQALARFPRVFSKIFVAMVKAGEESGNLSESLKVIASQLERAYILKKKIKGALIYPTIILIAIAGIGTLMMIKVVPTLSATFKELHVKLPASTQMIISVSNAMKGHIILTGLVFVAFVLFILLFPRTKRGAKIMDWVALHTPLIKELSKEINSAKMARTLSSLLSSGVDLINALDITGDVLSNHYHSNVLKSSTSHIKKGKPLSEVFEKNEKLFTPMVTEIVSVGEETGSLSELLLNIAEFYETEVAQKTKDMSTIIEPFLMLIVGAAVGFFAVAMISPIYSIGNAI